MADGFPYQRILVTGASSGIGRALTNRILESSSTAHVIAVGRRAGELEKLVQAHGADRVTAEPFDVSDLSALPAWIGGLVGRFPDLDAAVLNAGFQHMPDIAGRPADVDLGRIKEELEVNYLSPVQSTILLLPHLQRLKRPAAVVFVSSGLAVTPSVLCPTYSASKAAVHSFAWTLRAELSEASPHVKVVEVLPPAVRTELHTNQGLPQMGMELGEFVEEAWAGLRAGQDEVPVGMVKDRIEQAEGARRAMFQGFTNAMREERRKRAGADNGQ